MKKLVTARKTVTATLTVLTVIAWSVYLIFGENEGKWGFVATTPLFIALVYISERIHTKRTCDNKHESYARKCCAVHLIFGALVFIMNVLVFISGIPDSPPMLFFPAVIIISCTLTALNKYVYKSGG